jgi:two-component system phosphate regulon response regulator PhoB
MKLLVVEDEPTLRQALLRLVAQWGYAAQSAANAAEAIDWLELDTFDLVLLDLGLPDGDGLEVCRVLRQRPGQPQPLVLMLTGRDSRDDKLAGLEGGADDYVVKPFDPELLQARIRALLRRSGRVASKGSLAYADLAMDQDAHRVTRAGRPLHLGPTEYRLLEFFLQHPGRVFAREQLLDAVWGRDIHVEPRTVDVHIRRLRKAINQDHEVDLIRTVRSAGYALDSDPNRLG